MARPAGPCSKSVLVGINYPWLRCGWDFGAPPPGYGPRPALEEEVARDFARLRAAGVQIVRWFVLADGFTYGSGESAPRREGRGWRFAAPELPAGFVADFERLLVLCAQSELQLLPVLIDFHWGFPGLDRHTRDAATLKLWDRTPRAARALRLHAARARAARLPEGFVKGGRGALLRDAQESARFFERALVPLLDVSRRHASAIYAWELINEPDWIVRPTGLPRRLDGRGRIDAASMRRFLRMGLSAIADHGFPGTVGFASARALRRWDSVRHPLGLGLNQVHYYPSSALSRLAHARFGNGKPCMLGEFASHQSAPRPWPDLPSSRQDPSARLALAQASGYQAALLWSYRAQDRATDPDGAAIEAGIARFVHGSALLANAR
jgi:hypothetical protein